jgi:hypothetical protein
MWCCQFILNTVLCYKHCETKFDLGAGSAFGVDIYFYIVSASAFDSEAYTGAAEKWAIIKII